MRPRQTQFDADIAQHQEIERLVQKAQAQRRLFALRQHRGAAFGHFQRLSIGKAAKGGGVIHDETDAGIELLPHPWHREDKSRGHLLNVGVKGLAALGNVDGDAMPDRGRDRDDALGGVAQRQEGQDLVTRAQRHFRVVVGLRQKEPVRDHRALGRAGSARGIDQRGDVLAFAGVQVRLERGLNACVAVIGEFKECLPSHDLVMLKAAQAFHVVDNDLFNPRQLVLYQQVFVELFLVLDEQHLGAAVVELIGDLFFLQGRVEPVGDRADALDAEIGKHPFLVVFADDRHDVAGIDPQGHQRTTCLPGPVIVVGPGVFFPDAEIPFADRDRRPEFPAVLPKQLGQCVAAVDFKDGRGPVLCRDVVHRHVFLAFQRRSPRALSALMPR